MRTIVVTDALDLPPARVERAIVADAHRPHGS
jgi:hypothetical protein